MTHNRASTECIHHRTLAKSNSQGFHDEKERQITDVIPIFFWFIYILPNLNPNVNTTILQQITKLDAIYWLLPTILLDINTVSVLFNRNHEYSLIRTSKTYMLVI